MKNLLLLIVAISAAGLTALFANNWINSERQALKTSQTQTVVHQPTHQVLVVQDNLKAGNFVREESLKWQSWPKDGLADNYIVKGSRDSKEFVGAVVRNAIASGQPITDDLIVNPGERGFLAAVLGVGNRAVSVPVNATSGISGFIFPGDQVDLILTSKFNSRNADGKSQARYVTKTLLSGIRVLAIDQKTESENGGASPAKTVTMEVTPKQAEKVAIGLAMGNISLSLQSLAHDENQQREANRNFTLDTDVNALVAGLAKADSKERTVQLFRGENSEQTAF